MDAGSIIAGLKAHAVIARTSLEGAIGLAAVTGADDVVAPLVANRLDEVVGALTQLAGREAQSLIGPQVNVASTAKASISAFAKSAHSGTIPTGGALESARRSVAELGVRIAALG